MNNLELKKLYEQLSDTKYAIFKQEEKDTSKLRQIRKKIAVLKTTERYMEKKSG